MLLSDSIILKHFNNVFEVILHIFQQLIYLPRINIFIEWANKKIKPQKYNIERKKQNRLVQRTKLKREIPTNTKYIYVYLV